MKRMRAVELVEAMLHRLDDPQGWPLQLVQQVWLFGSFARGATEPHDVDVAVRFERDERMKQAVVQAIFSGGNPYAPLRRALAGSSRGLQFQFEDAAREQLEAEGTFMLPLWQRGDTLADALGVLHAIAEDPEAGRAERHDMIDAFEGLDRHIPRPVRTELIGWQQQEAITISRITLPDVLDDTSLLATPDMRWAFRRWNDDSPLRRAALAGLVLMKELAVDLDDVELAGQRLPTPRRCAGHRGEPRVVDQLEVAGLPEHPVLRHQRRRLAGGCAAYAQAPAERPGVPARAEGSGLPELTTRCVRVLPSRIRLTVVRNPLTHLSLSPGSSGLTGAAPSPPESHRRRPFSALGLGIL